MTVEIKRVFTPTFTSVLISKYRTFLRRSVWLYAISTAMIAYGLHGYDPRFTTIDVVLRWLIYFGGVCCIVLLLYPVPAAIAPRFVRPYVVVFRENDLCSLYKGKSIADSWDWIISAKDEPLMISLRIRKFPPLELYISKRNIIEDEYRTLIKWLVAHRKL